MSKNSQTLLLPLLLIALGSGWLLTAMGFALGIDWIWTIGLAMLGATILLLGGVDKMTIVLGPLFFSAAGLSLLRQTGGLSFEIEVPILIILSGVLMLLARAPQIPSPIWFFESGKS